MKPYSSKFLRKTHEVETRLPTKISCLRRVCVNIESPGNRNSCNYSPLDAIYYSGNEPTEEHKFEPMKQFMNASHQVFQMSTNGVQRDPYCSVSELAELCDRNCISEGTISALKSVIETLESNRSEQVNLGARIPSGVSQHKSTSFYSGDPSVSGSNQMTKGRSDIIPGGNQELNNLTELVRETMYKLDNYMAFQAEQQAGTQLNLDPYLMSEVSLQRFNKFQQPTPTKGRARRTVKVMPVQPLVIVPPQPTPAPVPAAEPASAAPPAVPLKPDRLRLRARRKRVPAEPKETTRDCGTTMWCPSKCCQCFCGVDGAQDEEQAQGLAPTMPNCGYPTPNSSYYPARYKAGRMKEQQRSNYGFNQQLVSDSEPHQSEDEWTSRSNPRTDCCHKWQQTESCDSTSDYSDRDTDSQSCKRFIATTDKAVNTSGDEKKPVKIVRIYKCSTLKSKRNQDKAEGKVRFQSKEVSKSKKARNRDPNPFIQREPVLTSSSHPSPSKLRILRTMSEATPETPRHCCRHKQQARFQRQLDEQQELEEAERESQFLRCRKCGRNRCRGGESDSSVDLLTTYPSSWTQLSMMD